MGEPDPVDLTKPVPKDFREICRKHYAWCAELSDRRFGRFSDGVLLRLNCGKPVKLGCNQKMKDTFRGECTKKVGKDKVKVSQCVKTMILLATMDGCESKGADKRGANLSPGHDTSFSLAIWASLGLLLLLLIGALVAWWYLAGGSSKKGGTGSRPSKGASQPGKSKSKMTTGKSKLGSRKSQASKQAASRGSQRGSKVIQQTSKGTRKSRRSGKKAK